MHPIERLRYVARADGAGPAILVRETALAISEMYTDTASLVLACRRIVERHPTMAQLWWLCAHVVTSGDPTGRARELALVVERDDTPGHLDDALADDVRVMTVGWPHTTLKCLVHRGDIAMLVVDSHGEGEALVDRLHDAEIAADLVPYECLAAALRSVDVVLIEALACGADAVLTAGGSRAVVETARALGIAVWLVGGVATRLPATLWQGMLTHSGLANDWHAGLDVIELSRFDRIVGPEGAGSAQATSWIAECPDAGELLRRSVI
jgi:hypothetical protein